MSDNSEFQKTLDELNAPCPPPPPRELPHPTEGVDLPPVEELLAQHTEDDDDERWPEPPYISKP